MKKNNITQNNPSKIRITQEESIKEQTTNEEETLEEKKTCQKCKKEIPKSAKFCIFCGTKTKEGRTKEEIIFDENLINIITIQIIVTIIIILLYVNYQITDDGNHFMGLLGDNLTLDYWLLIGTSGFATFSSFYGYKIKDIISPIIGTIFFSGYPILYIILKTDKFSSDNFVFSILCIGCVIYSIIIIITELTTPKLKK